MGSHKHGVSGHSRPNPRNMKQVAAALNAGTDRRAALRQHRRSDGMAGSIRDLFPGQSRPPDPGLKAVPA
jgi:hypothetical protein